MRLCPWSLALASSIPVLDLESVCPRKSYPWPWPRIFFVSLALASSLVSSTPPLLYHINEDNNEQAKLSASQYGFRAGISTETALHGFVRSVEY